jgi:hypothetical protein
MEALKMLLASERVDPSAISSRRGESLICVLVQPDWCSLHSQAAACAQRDRSECSRCRRQATLALCRGKRQRRDCQFAAALLQAIERQ